MKAPNFVLIKIPEPIKESPVNIPINPILREAQKKTKQVKILAGVRSNINIKLMEAPLSPMKKTGLTLLGTEINGESKLMGL